MKGFNLLSFIFCFVMLASAPALNAEVLNGDARFTDFNKKLKLVGGGHLRLNYEYFGEPINAPANLTLTVSCGKDVREVAVEVVPMCTLEKYHFDPKVSELTIGYTYSRVDAGGRVHCDQKNEKQFNLKKVCRTAFKAK